MAASPITGDRPSTGGFRRSSSNFASIPQRSLSFHEQAGLSKEDAAANILYTHPNVRIYKFHPPTDALKSLDKSKKTLPDADYPIDAIEVLPWRSRTEMLSAKGRLIIEKVQGSVHFLKAGELIHTIMKNSQCWCVDGESKFVMRVGNLRYQRIEFPTAEDDEKKKVEEFKMVISKILRFEKTPCPFIRGFHVDLPEDAITPRRRGTWKRRESLTPTVSDENTHVGRRSKASRTMSMRGMPPSSFPSKSMSQLDTDRPRTASTPTSSARFSFPDIRTESPTNYTSGEENTDSDRHDSESDRPESSHHSEADESDPEAHNVPIIRSPLKTVQTISSVEHPAQKHTFGRSQRNTAPRPAEQFPDASIKPPTNSQTEPEPAEIFDDTNGQADAGSSLAEEAIRATYKSLTGQESSEPPRAASFDNDEIKHAALTSGNNDSKNEPPKLEEIAEKQEVNESGFVLSLTERRSNDKSKGYESTHITKNDTSSKHPEGESSSLTKTPHVDSGALETIVYKPQATTGDNTLVHAENLQQARNRSPEGAATSAAPAEASPETSTEDLLRTRTNDDTESIISTDSFHTLLSDDSPTSTQTFLNTRPFQHRRELSEMTVTPASMNLDSSPTDKPYQAITALSSYEPYSTELEPWLEQQTPGAFLNGPELRQRLSHRRSLSPLPPASILTPNQSDQGSPIRKELFQKAATLAVVKPIEIVMFMVHILSRIAQGATMSDLMSGDLFRRPGARRTATGTFDQDVRGRTTARDSEDEDDYGFGRRKSSNRTSDGPGYGNDGDDDVASFGSID